MIGAGPGGLVAARWLLSQGFEPTIFEQGPTLGGQWTGLDGRSGVWPAMHTNSSRILTAFSDLEHDDRPRLPVEPRHSRLPASLCRDIRPDVAHPIRHPGRTAQTRRGRMARRHAGSEMSASTGSWWPAAGFTPPRSRRVRGSTRSPARQERSPPTTTGGLALSRQARPGRGLRDQRARDRLRTRAARRRTRRGDPAATAVRRCRSSPPESPPITAIYTRYGALANETLPAAEIDRQLKEIVVEAAGSPEQYGAPAPDPSLFAAGVTLNQQYLPLVAEGRITVRPWMKSVAGATVTFADGHAEEFDGIVFGTGFDTVAAVSERRHPGDPRPRRGAPGRRPLHLPSRSAGAGLRGHVGPVGRILRAAGTSGQVDRVHVGRHDPAAE